MALNVKAALTRKVGPLPVWAWGAAGVGGIAVARYMVRRREAPGLDSETMPTGLSDAAIPVDLGAPDGAYLPPFEPSPFGYDPGYFTTVTEPIPWEPTTQEGEIATEPPPTPYTGDRLTRLIERRQSLTTRIRSLRQGDGSRERLQRLRARRKTVRRRIQRLRAGSAT